MPRGAFGAGLAAWTGSLCVAVSAVATPIPRPSDLVARARVIPPHERWAAMQPRSAPPYQSTRIHSIETTLELEPASGTVQAEAKLEIEALNGSVSTVMLLLDSGLTVSAATAPGKTVSVAMQPYPPYTYGTLAFSPPLAQGEKVVVTASYSGQLGCGSQMCQVGSSFAFVGETTALPAIVDQDMLGMFNIWGATRTLELRLPSGTGAIATGDLVAETDDGTKAIRRWVTPGYHGMGGYLAVIGNWQALPVSGATPTTTVHHLAGQPTWGAQMVGWMQSIVPFLDAQAGAKLPFTALQVVKLPIESVFPGTAGHGITLLNESYGAGTPEYFEETLAHENSHLWWGILVSPTDTPVTRWLVEGMATLSQIDYAADHLNPNLSREAFLARRYREHQILLRYHVDGALPSLVAPSPSVIPEDQVQSTLWAYVASSALLEYLRVVVGDATFSGVLTQWAGDCAQKFCDTTDFLSRLETASGLDFDPVFSQFVYGTDQARPVLGFEQAGGSGPVSVTAQGIDGLTLPVELWITLEDGSVSEQRVTFVGSTPVTLDVGGRVRSVRPNPRHDGWVWSSSAQPGDLDFDGEVDGFDLIHCAFRETKTTDLSQPGGEGLWSVDLDFDPRCDVNADGLIETGDLTTVTDAFGTRKGAP